MGFIYSLVCLPFVSVVANAREVSHCPAQLLCPALSPHNGVLCAAGAGSAWHKDILKECKQRGCLDL